MSNKVIKRTGKVVDFDKEKIIEAIKKAMTAELATVNLKVAEKIADEIASYVDAMGDNPISIEEIEKLVYDKLISHRLKNVARAYEGYRAIREYQRKTNTIDDKVLGVIKGNDENIKDNSNKATTLVSTKRDLVAEEVSKDIALRMMLPADIANAHNEGLIYIHDLGHYLNPSFNCCLVNLEDMLQNGTVINRKKICKPHSLRTASTIATQIIAQVASGQFGGQTITISHLAPFVRITEEKIRKDVNEEAVLLNAETNQNFKEKIVQKRLKEEISASMQTFQYQINTLQTSNGR